MMNIAIVILEIFNKVDERTQEDVIVAVVAKKLRALCNHHKKRIHHWPFQ